MRDLVPIIHSDHPSMLICTVYTGSTLLNYKDGLIIPHIKDILRKPLNEKWCAELLVGIYTVYGVNEAIGRIG